MEWLAWHIPGPLFVSVRAHCILSGHRLLCLETSWPLDILWPVHIPCALPAGLLWVSFSKLGSAAQTQRGPVAMSWHHILWGTGFPQLSYFVICLWNFLFHRFIFPSLLSLNKIWRLPCSVIPFYTLFLFSQTLAGNLPNWTQGESDHWHTFSLCF